MSSANTDRVFARCHKVVMSLAALILLIVTSCKKENMCDCFKSTGDFVEVERDAGEFTDVFIKGNEDIVLVQDTVNRIIVRAGEHLIDMVETKVSNGCLYIDNKIRCIWARKYDARPVVTIHAKNFRYINSEGVGDVFCSNTIVQPDTFSMEVYNAMGVFHLSLNARASSIAFHTGPGDLELSGKAGISYIYSNGFGILDAQHFDADTTVVTLMNLGDAYVSAGYFLAAGINYLGNVYYRGNPTTIINNDAGEGALIFLEN
ncbi:MAG: DUF2807 domain-containing protein [Bacteroidetes bacterium]|nr:DUF2807 domain-containing protein [Bacteroidota bacterium]MBU1717591.1 DUF2807 domain-containing protein [Bacteroidota bacterium]